MANCIYTVFFVGSFLLLEITQNGNTSKGRNILVSCLGLWIRDYHRTVCASISFRSHDTYVDILCYMDLLDILEQNVYAEEDIWSQKSSVWPYYKYFTLNSNFLFKINSSRPPVKPRFSSLK